LQRRDARPGRHPGDTARFSADHLLLMRPSRPSGDGSLVGAGVASGTNSGQGGIVGTQVPGQNSTLTVSPGTTPTTNAANLSIGSSNTSVDIPGGNGCRRVRASARVRPPAAPHRRPARWARRRTRPRVRPDRWASSAGAGSAVGTAGSAAGTAGGAASGAGGAVSGAAAGAGGAVSGAAGSVGNAAGGALGGGAGSAVGVLRPVLGMPRAGPWAASARRRAARVSDLESPGSLT
jgi:hypothetical protein